MPSTRSAQHTKKKKPKQRQAWNNSFAACTSELAMHRAAARITHRAGKRKRKRKRNETRGNTQRKAHRLLRRFAFLPEELVELVGDARHAALELHHALLDGVQLAVLLVLLAVVLLGLLLVVQHQRLEHEQNLRSGSPSALWVGWLIWVRWLI
eukprot:1704057-Rhodomonas_salina.1